MILTEARHLRKGDFISGVGLVTGIRPEGGNVFIRIHNNGPSVVRYQGEQWIELSTAATSFNEEK